VRVKGESADPAGERKLWNGVAYCRRRISLSPVVAESADVEFVRKAAQGGMKEVELGNLSGLSGAAFDRAYMAKMVTDHQATVELFEAEARDGKDDALRKWAAQKLPTVRGHLEKARALQSKVAKTAPCG
jgi:uncharacterized protein (DUF305 family)